MFVGKWIEGRVRERYREWDRTGYRMRERGDREWEREGQRMREWDRELNRGGLRMGERGKENESDKDRDGGGNGLIVIV